MFFEGELLAMVGAMLTPSFVNGASIFVQIFVQLGQSIHQIANLFAVFLFSTFLQQFNDSGTDKI